MRDECLLGSTEVAKGDHDDGPVLAEAGTAAPDDAAGDQAADEADWEGSGGSGGGREGRGTWKAGGGTGRAGVSNIEKLT